MNMKLLSAIWLFFASVILHEEGYCNMSQNSSDYAALQLNYSGPGVLDSNIVFSAQLLATNGSVVDKASYVYLWRDTAAHMDKNKTVNNTESQLQKVYYSNKENYKPGSFQMIVKVYKLLENGVAEKYTTASGNISFILTEMLNGHLRLYQNLSLQLYENTFSTGKPLLGKVKVTDSIKILNVSYLWHLDNSSTIATTPDPFYWFEINRTGVQYIGVTADTICSVPLHDKQELVNKTGLWKDYIWFKDPVSNVTYSGSHNYSEGDLLTANISCEGSSPFHICSNISFGARSPENCTQFEARDTCSWTVDKNLTKTGIYTVYVVVKNDVSIQSLNIRVTVSQPGLGRASALLVIACILVGVLSLALIMYAYTKQRKKTHRKTETADFDFHTPSAHSSSSFSIAVSLERLKGTVSSWFSSDNSRGGIDSEFNSSYKLHVRNYGAINLSDEDSMVGSVNSSAADIVM